MIKSLTLILAIIWIATGLSAQSAIQGKVTDADTEEELIGANVLIYKDGVFITGTSTDFDGNYKAKVDPGIYDVEASYIGYPNQKVIEVPIKAGEVRHLDISFISDQWELPYLCGVPYYRIPLIDREDTSSKTTQIDEQIEKSPHKDVRDLSLNVPGLTSY